MIDDEWTQNSTNLIKYFMRSKGQLYCEFKVQMQAYLMLNIIKTQQQIFRQILIEEL